MTTSRHRIAYLCAIALLATGCQMDQPAQPSPSSTGDALRALPSLEDTTTQVQTAMDEITTAASKLVPNLK
jgi:hypothetical protein